MAGHVQKKSDLSLLQPVLEEYGAVKGSLITILQKAQEIYGYLPLDVMYYIAENVGKSPADVVGVATFYAQFRFEAVGRYLIMLCQGTACHVNGSERMADVINEELHIKDGETTEDGMFSLKEVACLGCCSLSPVMMINGQTYSSLTPARVREVLKQLRAQAEEEDK